MKEYLYLFSPAKIGGLFFITCLYPRYLFFGVNSAIFSVIAVMLKSQALTMQEIAILTQILTIAVFFIPLFGSMRLGLLTKICVVLQLIVILLLVLYAVDTINTKQFLYLYTLLEFMFIIVYSNISSVFSNYVQYKTLPETSEYRTRGNMVISALGTLLGTILVIILSGMNNNIKYMIYLLIISNTILTIAIYVTNIYILKFAYDDEKYPRLV